MHWIGPRIVVLGFAALLTIGLSIGGSGQVAAAQQISEAAAASQNGFNDEYIFATTRGVNDMDRVHPALKLTLFPVTIVLDTVFLPFAVVAGFVA